MLVQLYGVDVGSAVGVMLFSCRCDVGSTVGVMLFQLGDVGLSVGDDAGSAR